MNSLRNSVQLIGNLGMDPDVKTLESGKKVAKFSIATAENFKNGEGKKVNETTWHNLVLWDKLAEISGKYLKKGHQVAVEGRIVYRNYEDKNGVKKYITEIVVNELLMLKSPRDQE
jgi:single-strand DNA-binding protein